MSSGGLLVAMVTNSDRRRWFSKLHYFVHCIAMVILIVSEEIIHTGPIFTFQYVGKLQFIVENVMWQSNFQTAGNIMSYARG